MIDAWRLAAPEYSRTVADMLSGEGARRYGGRWNSPGRRAIYLSSSLALASMELLVHLRAPRVLRAYRKLPVRIPETVVSEIAHQDLPIDWGAPGLHPFTQQIGDRWLASGKSAVLQVPSAVVIAEVNYIVNPGHPDYAGIAAGEITDFRYDSRILKTAQLP